MAGHSPTDDLLGGGSLSSGLIASGASFVDASIGGSGAWPGKRSLGSGGGEWLGKRSVAGGNGAWLGKRSVIGGKGAWLERTVAGGDDAAGLGGGGSWLGNRSVDGLSLVLLMLLILSAKLSPRLSLLGGGGPRKEVSGSGES